MSDLLNEDVWVDTYQPIQNPSSNDIFFDTHDKYLATVDPKQIWTWTEESGVGIIQAGYWRINRIAYFVCEKKWEDEDLWFEYYDDSTEEEE